MFPMYQLCLCATSLMAKALCTRQTRHSASRVAARGATKTLHTSHMWLAAATSASLQVLCGVANAQSCDPQWAAEVFCLPGVDDRVRASATWDDGTGLALYVAGSFNTAGSQAGISNVAKWDGETWHALEGPEGVGTSFWASALAVYDDGTGPALFVGGGFKYAGGVTVNRIAKWDGSTWSALEGPHGTGIGGSWVTTLEVYDDGTGPALYVGGDFEMAGGVPANYVARWDGEEWSALEDTGGNGANYQLESLVVYDDGSGPALYVGGSFATAGGKTVNHIAKWDGTTWSPLVGPGGIGVNDEVEALTVFDDGSGQTLYVGGRFDTAGGVTANNIAKWDGTNWSAVEGPGGNGVDHNLYALQVFDDGSGPALYAGGLFENAGGLVTNHVARWDGSTWSPLSGPAGTGMSWLIDTMTVFDDGSGPALYAGGMFEVAGGVAASRVAAWNGSSWSALDDKLPSRNGVSGAVNALAIHDDGSGPALFAGGNFDAAGSAVTDNVAKWDGLTWSALGSPGEGPNSHVRALVSFDDGAGPALFVGGSFTHAGSVEVNRIAKWDRNAWTALEGPNGIGVSGNVFALAVFDDGTGEALYAGGSFTEAGGVSTRRIAKWDGQTWSALIGSSSNPLGGPVRTMTVFDDGTGAALYVGGDLSHVARWDGSDWTTLVDPNGNGMNSWVEALAIFDDGSGPSLFAGGGFTVAGGVPANRVARWDGTAWAALEGPGGNGLDDRVQALATFESGTGPALYAAGELESAGGKLANRIAKWDGVNWTALSGPEGEGTDDDVNTLLAANVGGEPALYLGGRFATAGGQASPNLAKWYVPFCAIDLNHDCRINTADFIAFLNAYATGDDIADWNNDGRMNTADFIHFLNDWNLGC